MEWIYCDKGEYSNPKMILSKNYEEYIFDLNMEFLLKTTFWEDKDREFTFDDLQKKTGLENKILQDLLWRLTKDNVVVFSEETENFIYNRFKKGNDIAKKAFSRKNNPRFWLLGDIK